MKKLLIVALMALFISSCATQSEHPAFYDAGYAKWMENTDTAIKKNTNYERIPIDSKAQRDHFISLSYKAYKKEISKKAFIREMNSKYQGYSKSIRWIANLLPN